ncbi:MAG: CAP domain-containing protein [Proteobacteria bacterium]|nr:CAP domain-containing protein [Pseudomonadota bacterium]
MMQSTHHILIAVALAIAGGCGGGGSRSGDVDAAAGGNNPPGGGGEIDAARVACMDRINGFRATEGLPPLERWVDGEACGDEQARLDASGGGPHGNFGMCGESGQNTCPFWPTIEAVVKDCLQAMWDEGPGDDFSKHGHYLNMSSTRYSKVACAFYRGDNDVWASQNFR